METVLPALLLVLHYGIELAAIIVIIWTFFKIKELKRSIRQLEADVQRIKEKSKG